MHGPDSLLQWEPMGDERVEVDDIAAQPRDTRRPCVVVMVDAFEVDLFGGAKKLVSLLFEEGVGEIYI